MYHVDPHIPDIEVVCIHCKWHKIKMVNNGWTDTLMEENYCWNKKTRSVFKCFVTGTVDKYYRKCISLNGKGDCEFFEAKEETLRNHFEEHQRNVL